MNSDFRPIFDYLDSRDKSAYNRLKEKFETAGLKGPAKFGSKVDKVGKPAGDAIQAKADALTTSLKLAAGDFDKLISDVESKANRRYQLKLGSAVISAISSSSLIGLLGTSNPAGSLTYVAASLSLLSALATVLQDYVGIRTPAFWEGLVKASQSRERIDNILFQVSIARLEPSASEALDNLVPMARDILAELKGLLRGLRIDRVRPPS
jgi:hypothetical protein